MPLENRLSNQEIRERRIDVYVPPCANFCPVFERGNCVIDPRTQEMLIGISETEKEKPTKRIIVFLGMPGAGKSTQVNEIVEATGAPVYHLGKFAKRLQESDPTLQAEIAQTRAEGKLITGLDELFLAEINNDPAEEIILDGFPRAIDQLVMLQDQALMNRWKLEVVYVSFPKENALELSMQRQVSRHVQEKGQPPAEIDTKKFAGKIARAVEQDMQVVEALLHTGVANVITLDGTQPADVVTQTLRKELKLDYESLPFDRETLLQLEGVASDLGIEAWGSSGMIYRAFWNGTYGPLQESTDFDIWTETPEEAVALLTALESRYPEKRWAVESWQAHSEVAYSASKSSFTESLVDRVLTFRQAAVRLQNNTIDLQLARGAEADLRQGIIRIDEEALNRLPPDNQEYHLQKTLATIKRQLKEYPGLRLEGKVAQLYAEKYGVLHQPVDITAKWSELEEQVAEFEFGGRTRWNHQFTDEEKLLAQETVNTFRFARKEPSAPPKPKKSHLPIPLEHYKVQLLEAKARNDKESIEQLQQPITPPEGYSSWLHYVCVNATDNEFREWLLNQVRSRNPIGGGDETLQTLFSYEQFDAFTKNSKLDGEQKVTHQGWQLEMHLKEATFQLQTDGVAARLSEPEASKVRFAMRVALLYHDVGKLLNVNTPGSHEGVGAKLFLRCKPDWIPDDIAQITAGLIRLHDVFGRLSRGLCEKIDMKITDPGFDVTAQPSYKGALDPQIVRDEVAKLGLDFTTSVAMVKAVWTADVGSVASLRWILPLADKLELLILAGEPTVGE